MHGIDPGGGIRGGGLSQQKAIRLAGRVQLGRLQRHEFGIKARVLCSGECNIRVDLLFFWPLLLLLLLLSGVAIYRLMRRGPNVGRVSF